MLATGGSLCAQDNTNAWLRYAVRTPIGPKWTLHSEPDFRTRLGPGTFNQFLLRVDAQRKVASVHTVGIGIVGVRSVSNGRMPVLEWRPQFTWSTRPVWARDLMMRGRLEWRQQYTSGSSETISTLRCRLLIQLEAPFRRDAQGMRSGLRGHGEILVRAYRTTTEGTFSDRPYDQSRLAMAYVTRLSGHVELEGAWLWMFRDSSLVEQYFRVGVVHTLGYKA
ncbi:MAG: DUF2490 domain-containing protein [Flavobacteriales bacterium]